jgi:GDP-4-dehydro-6-deoxy-D-mannose reductase
MFTPSRILITGFSGFVGGYLVDMCRTVYPDAMLFGLSRHPAPRTPLPAAKYVTQLLADITHPEQIRQVVNQSQPDLIFHLAAQSSVAASWNDPLATLQANAGGTIQLLEALRAEHLSPRVVLVGSGEQYGLVKPEENPINEEQLPRPINPYGISKLAQDLYGYQYFKAYGIPILRTRPFNHFGPRQPSKFVVADFARQIALIEQGQAEPVISVGNLQARRDFLPVEDVVRAYLALAQQGRPGEAYNIGSGRGYSIGEILEMLLACSPVSIQVCEDPARFRPVDIPLLVADISRIIADTEWRPMLDVATALKQTLAYWRMTVRQEATPLASPDTPQMSV